MSKVLVEGFVHRPGGHCGSSAMRDILSFYGLDLSEEMVFGLGSGIGFLYYDDPSMVPPILLGGRSWDMEQVLCKNLEIGLEVKSGLGEKEAWSAVKGMIDDNKPAIVHVDVYHLDYLRAKRHFSQHRILVVGYDEDAGIAFVSDNDRDEIQELPLESLARARSSIGIPIPADNAYYVLTMPEKFPALDKVIPGAIRHTVNSNMLVSPEKASFEHNGVHVAVGLAGLEIFASGITGWTQVMDEDAIGFVCKNIYVSAEKGGTGYGGNFRRLYGRFLIESADILGRAVLRDIGGELISIGDRWTDLAMTCKDKSGSGEAVVKDISPIAKDIYEREMEAFKMLGDVSSLMD